MTNLPTLTLVRPSDPLFSAVLALGRKHSRYLGHFPRGAFRDAAIRGQIIGAFIEGDRLAGYLLYRVSRGYATIVHFCVDAEFRGRGVAHMMFDELKRRQSVMG